MLRNFICPLRNTLKNTFLYTRCAFSTEESLKIDPPGKSPRLPFTIERVKVSGKLPIYTDIRNGRTRVTTIIRKIHGDKDEFVRQLQEVVPNKSIQVRAGSVEVNGYVVKEVTKWLTSLHF